MVLTTQTIDAAAVHLIVGDVDTHDDSIIARNKHGEIFRVPRFLVETPRVRCEKCNTPARHTVVRGKDHAECPNHARHQYETLYTASHDHKNHNRKQRHQLHRKAGYWLRKWRAQAARNSGKLQMSDPEMLSVKMSDPVAPNRRKMRTRAARKQGKQFQKAFNEGAFGAGDTE